jgi:hypothetical protein
VEQFRGWKSSESERETEEAFQEFVEHLKSGQISVAPKLSKSIVRPTCFQELLSPFESTVGIPLDEPELAERIVQHYLELERKSGIRFLENIKSALSDKS